MKSNYKIDEATRNKLYKKEQWHFTVVQLGWFTIGIFLTSMWELIIFAEGFLGSDYYADNYGHPIQGDDQVPPVPVTSEWIAFM